MQATIYVTEQALAVADAIKDLDQSERLALSDDPATDLSTSEGYYLKCANRLDLAVLPPDALVGRRLTPEVPEVYEHHVSFPHRGCIFENAPNLAAQVVLRVARYQQAAERIDRAAGQRDAIVALVAGAFLSQHAGAGEAFAVVALAHGISELRHLLWRQLLLEHRVQQIAAQGVHAHGFPDDAVEQEAGVLGEYRLDTTPVLFYIFIHLGEHGMRRRHGHFGCRGLARQVGLDLVIIDWFQIGKREGTLVIRRDGDVGRIEAKGCQKALGHARHGVQLIDPLAGRINDDVQLLGEGDHQMAALVMLRIDGLIERDDETEKRIPRSRVEAGVAEVRALQLGQRCGHTGGLVQRADNVEHDGGHRPDRVTTEGLFGIDLAGCEVRCILLRLDFVVIAVLAPEGSELGDVVGGTGADNAVAGSTDELGETDRRCGTDRGHGSSFIK